MESGGLEPLGPYFQRVENFVESSFEQDLMVTHVDTRDTVILNATAAAIWETLKWPQTTDSLSDFLLEAFPGQSREKLANQVDEVLKKLRLRGLVLRVTNP